MFAFVDNQENVYETFHHFSDSQDYAQQHSSARKSKFSSSLILFQRLLWYVNYVLTLIYLKAETQPLI